MIDNRIDPQKAYEVTTSSGKDEVKFKATSGKDKALNSINRGLRSIPLLGSLISGIIPERTNGTIPMSDIREAVNIAYRNLDKLSTTETAKLNKIMNELENYASMIGSSSLIAFVNERKRQAENKKGSIEQSLNNIENQRRDLDNSLQDVSELDQIDRRADNYSIKTLQDKINNTIKGENL